MEKKINMKTEEEIRVKISEIRKGYSHVLDVGGLASIQINAPRALMQIKAIGELDILYWILGEKRPQLAYDTNEINT